MSSLVARSATYAATGLVSQAAVLLLWLFIPWFLPAAEVGFLALALFAVELLTMLGSLGMDAALVRFAGKADTRGAVFGIALILAAGALVLLATVVPFGLDVVRQLSANTANWVGNHYPLVVAAVAANISWNLVQSLLTAARSAKDYAFLQIARAGAQLVLGYCGLRFFQPDAATILLALTIATVSTLSGLVFLLRLVKLPNIPRNPFRTGNVDDLVRYGLSMLAYGMLGVAFNYTQRLVMDNYASIAAVGVFAFFNVIVLQANGMWNALAKAWMPEFFSLVESDRLGALQLLRGMLVLLCVSFPLALVIGVIADEAGIVRLVLPPEYATRTALLWAMVLSLMFNGLYTIAAPLYYHVLRTRLILTITFFLTVVNIFASILFIKLWGAEGAAAAFFLLMALTLWTYLSFYRDWVDGRLPGMLAAVTVITFAAAMLLLLTGAVWLFVGLLCAASLVAWVLGASAARPLIRRLAGKMHREF